MEYQPDTNKDREPSVPSSRLIGDEQKQSATSRWARPMFRRPAQGLRSLITKNMHLKLLSFALALVLWTRVSEDQQVTENTQVLLDVQYPDELVVLQPPPARIGVQVSLPKSRLKALEEADLKISVDLSRVDVGRTDVSITSLRIRNLPRDVQVVQYYTSSFPVEFDARIRRDVKVMVRTEGEPAQGYRIARKISTPPSVTLVGPERSLSTLPSVRTVPVQIEGIEHTRTSRYALDLYDQMIQVEGGSEEVLITVEVEAVIGERTFQNIEVAVPETIGKCELIPKHASMKFKGPEALLQKMKPSDVQILLQEGSTPMEDFEETRTLRYPPGKNERGVRILATWPSSGDIELIEMQPDKFRLRLSRE